MALDAEERFRMAAWSANERHGVRWQRIDTATDNDGISVSPCAPSSRHVGLPSNLPTFPPSHLPTFLSYDYEPWGLLMPGRTLAGPTREGFTSKERDAESGFDYFGARYYMPAVGRWAAIDPLADEEPEFSGYSYVLNNPLGLVDPDGRQARIHTGYVPLMQDIVSRARWQQFETDYGAYIVHALDALVFTKLATLDPGPQSDVRGSVLKGGTGVVTEVRVGAELAGNARSAAVVVGGQVRAKELHALVGARTQRATTVAVTDTKEGVPVVSSSERRLRPGQRAALRHGEEVEGVGRGHAEATGINTAKQRGLTPTGTAASRPICADCAKLLESQKVRPLSPLKRPQ